MDARQRLPSSKLADRDSAWNLVGSGEALATDHGLTIVPKGVTENAPRPAFWFFQKYTNSFFRWELCVKFDNWIAGTTLARKIQALPEAANLRAQMEKLSLVPKRAIPLAPQVTELPNGRPKVTPDRRSGLPDDLG